MKDFAEAIVLFCVGIIISAILPIIVNDISVKYIMLLNEDTAKECIKNGGTPYYFSDSVECKNIIKIEEEKYNVYTDNGVNFSDINAHGELNSK